MSARRAGRAGGVGDGSRPCRRLIVVPAGGAGRGARRSPSGDVGDPPPRGWRMRVAAESRPANL